MVELYQPYIKLNFQKNFIQRVLPNPVTYMVRKDDWSEHSGSADLAGMMIVIDAPKEAAVREADVM